MLPKCKNTILFLGLLYFPICSLNAQENYMDTIVEQACSCVSEIGDEEELNSTNLGLCILNEAVKFKEELLQDHNINMANIDTEGEALGRLVALEMLSVCPDQLKRMVNAGQNEREANDREETSYYSVTGQVKSIQKSDFISFSITNVEGKTSKFYWLTFIEGNFDIQEEYNALEGKKVEVSYSEIELYDPKIREYRTFNVIDSFSILEE
jgi:hypothetical protein